MHRHKSVCGVFTKTKLSVVLIANISDPRLVRCHLCGNLAKKTVWLAQTEKCHNLRPLVIKWKCLFTLRPMKFTSDPYFHTSLTVCSIAPRKLSIRRMGNQTSISAWLCVANKFFPEIFETLLRNYVFNYLIVDHLFCCFFIILPPFSPKLNKKAFKSKASKKMFIRYVMRKIIPKVSIK